MSTTRAVILARGLGTRMRAADPAARLDDRQRTMAAAGLKALIPVGGRPFLDYIVSAAADAGIHLVALVVGPEHDAVRRHYDQEPPHRVTIDFVVQPEARGTADAVLAAEGWTDGHTFLVLNGDNLYPADVLRATGELDEPGLPAFERDDLVRSGNFDAERVAAFAVIDLDDRGYLTRIVEKPPADLVVLPPALVSMNCWHFDSRIFAACRDVPVSARGELELPQAVGLAVTRGVAFKVIPARGPVLDLSRRADAADISRRLAGVIPLP